MVRRCEKATVRFFDLDDPALPTEGESFALP
jgi:hypothetical protein